MAVQTMEDAWAASFMNSTHSPGALAPYVRINKISSTCCPGNHGLLLHIVLYCRKHCYILFYILFNSVLAETILFVNQVYSKQYCMFSFSLLYIVSNIVLHSNNIVIYLVIYCKLLFYIKKILYCIVFYCLLYCFNE